MIQKLQNYLFAIVLAGCAQGVPSENVSLSDLGRDLTANTLEQRMNNLDGGENKDSGNILQDAEQVDALSQNCPEPRPYNLNQEGVCAGSLQDCIKGQWRESTITEPNFEEVEETCDDLDNDCNGMTDEELQSLFYRDQDGDGFGDQNTTVYGCLSSPLMGYVSNGSDCNDQNNLSYPRMEEVCDGLDNNCDGQIDEELSLVYYLDSDEDGQGDPERFIVNCVPPGPEYITNNTDCNDRRFDIYLGAEELCDGLDNNCDNNIDENVRRTFYHDADNDGFGNNLDNVIGCNAPLGYITNNTDCDDINSNINPGSTEICDYIDNNCNGDIDEEVMNRYYLDSDGDDEGTPTDFILACSLIDGFSQYNTDCDDENELINLNGDEFCDGLDNDCDGSVDGGVLLTFYADNDNDTYGDARQDTYACSTPAGYVANNTDCDDSWNTVHPGLTEICDGLDNDCNDVVDDNLTRPSQECFNGIGECRRSGLEYLTCQGSVGWSTTYSGCDAVPRVPVTELCDGLDNDCNNVVDNGVLQDFYQDNDGDNFGNALQIIRTCIVPTGYVSNNTDCDDNRITVRPGLTEICDGLDNDCDDIVDDNLTRPSQECFNGIGECRQPGLEYLTCQGSTGWSTSYSSCDAVSGAPVTELCDGRDNDCDNAFDNGFNIGEICYNETGECRTEGSNTCSFDGSRAVCNAPPIIPTAEICDGIDNDCNGIIDDDTGNTYYRDVDSDTHGNPLDTRVACSTPVGYVSNNDDCDDSTALRYTGLAEVCDDIDNDCNDVIDNGVQLTFYRDTDGDTFGNNTQTTIACTAPEGYVSNNTDCDDALNTIRPGLAELCDGLDNDCNDVVDDNLTRPSQECFNGIGECRRSGLEYLTCQGSTGWSIIYSGCDAVAGGPAVSRCDGNDNDCDGYIDCNGLIGRIVFVSERDGATEIYIMNADGSDQRRLTTNSEYRREPALSTIGRIVFTGEGSGGFQLYSMDDNGGDVITLTESSGFAPAWSPDSTRIAFYTGNIIIINADGTNQRTISNSLRESYNPSWSPEGDRIAFWGAGNTYDIYIMNTNGTSLANLTNDSPVDRNPSWSPDGTRIAFESSRSGSYETYIMNTDGSNQSYLVNGIHPTWSPDNTHLAFSANRDGNEDIYIVTSNGIDIIRLTNTPENDYEPSWSN